MKLLKFFLLSSLFIPLQVFANPPLSTVPENIADSTIFISEELVIPLPVNKYKLILTMSSSAKTAQEAVAELEITRKRLQTLIGSSTLSVVNRSFSGGSGAGSTISQNSSIVVSEEIIATINEDTIARAIDGIASIPQAKLNEVKSSKDDLYDLKNKSSSQAVKLALSKAKMIAQDQGLDLGQIVDVSISEEPTTSSIREQLDTMQAGSVENIREIKIVASLRIKLIKK
jgi:hypothetical protein